MRDSVSAMSVRVFDVPDDVSDNCHGTFELIRKALARISLYWAVTERLADDSGAFGVGHCFTVLRGRPGLFRPLARDDAAFFSEVIEPSAAAEVLRAGSKSNQIE